MIPQWTYEIYFRSELRFELKRKRCETRLEFDQSALQYANLTKQFVLQTFPILTRLYLDFRDSLSIPHTHIVFQTSCESFLGLSGCSTSRVSHGRPLPHYPNATLFGLNYAGRRRVGWNSGLFTLQRYLNKFFFCINNMKNSTFVLDVHTREMATGSFEILCILFLTHFSQSTHFRRFFLDHVRFSCSHWLPFWTNWCLLHYYIIVDNFNCILKCLFWYNILTHELEGEVDVLTI